MLRYTAPGRSTGSIALSVFAIGYAGLLLSFLVNLRLMYGPMGYGGADLPDCRRQAVGYGSLLRRTPVWPPQNGAGAESRKDAGKGPPEGSQPPVWEPGCAMAGSCQHLLARTLATWLAGRSGDGCSLA